ncbi:hypothetical protein [Winogradskyella endarachnes]|uniref:Uncharacterized protein n=1 Tax=Winogradskyella endarachnes TaxID=2681965 RepID=A0A6L6UFS5_9FLAO|nr:hypothetical protein [Winogradskyella endarachnes]MUU79812.1 hypothetical protein [Winogradskyella endarachnes]
MAQSDEAQKQLSEKFIVMGAIDLSYIKQLEETQNLVEMYESHTGNKFIDFVSQLLLQDSTKDEAH